MNKEEFDGIKKLIKSGHSDEEIAKLKRVNTASVSMVRKYGSLGAVIEHMIEIKKQDVFKQETQEHWNMLRPKNNKIEERLDLIENRLDQIHLILSTLK